MCVTLVNELRENCLIGRHRLAIGLRDRQEFRINASCVITVLKGAICFWGATLKAAANKDHLITLSPGQPVPDIKGEVLHEDLLDPCPKCNGFCEDSPVLCDLSKSYPVFCVVAVTDNDIPNPEPLITPDSWYQLSDKLWDRPERRVMLAGALGMGKSTLCQWLVNDWVTRKGTPVVLMDMDPGQPMFGVPGCVSLRLVLKPILSNSAATRSVPQVYGDAGLASHGTVLIASHFVGSISPAGCFDVILSSVHDFTEQYRRLVSLTELTQPLPLLLNTCGWVTGMGWQLLDAAAAIIECSDMLMLMCSEEDGSSTREWQRLSSSRHPFQATLARLGVSTALPYFDPHCNHPVVIHEVPSCLPPVERNAAARAASRAERFARHLLVDRISSEALRNSLSSEENFNRQLLATASALPLDKFIFLTKKNNLSRSNLDVIFKGSLVALRKSQGAKLFISMAIVTAIDWTSNEILLVVPSKVDLKREQHPIEIVSGNQLKAEGLYEALKRLASQPAPEVLEKALTSVIKMKKRPTKKRVIRTRKKSVMHRMRLFLKPRIMK